MLEACTSSAAKKKQHVLQQLQKFHISEIGKTKNGCCKWKQLHPGLPSAWPFATHWPARARPSASLLPLALTSPSLWTPGARINTVWGPRRRSRAPKHSAEMPRAGKNLPKRSKPLQLRSSLMMKNLLLHKCSSVTNVIMLELPKRG